jgi:ankyrin repeat protein
VDVVELLLSRGDIDVNAVVSGGLMKGYTALHLAAMNGRVDVVQALLAAPGINVNAANENGWTALHVAAEYRHAGVIQALLGAGADVNAQISYGPWKGWTALHWAAQNGDVEVIRALLAAPNINVNNSDKSGYTALHFAARKGFVAVAQTVGQALLAVPGISLVFNCFSNNMNAAGGEGKAPFSLYSAAKKRYVKAVKLLLKKGARVNIRVRGGLENGKTALDLAKFCSWGDRDATVALLRARGAKTEEELAAERSAIREEEGEEGEEGD